MITELILLLAASGPGVTPAAAAPRPAAVLNTPEGQRPANLASLLLRQQETRLQEHGVLANRQNEVLRLGLRLVAQIPARPTLARLIPAINRQIMTLQNRLNVLQASLGPGQTLARQVLARLQRISPPPSRTAALVRLESMLRPLVVTAQGRPPATPIRIPTAG